MCSPCQPTDSLGQSVHGLGGLLGVPFSMEIFAALAPTPKKKASEKAADNSVGDGEGDHASQSMPSVLTQRCRSRRRSCGPLRERRANCKRFP